jgi:2-keto-4-pentenoate hydratase/2-oxohepta-3-ene-1,7-dioic acid hydratase in catechol pathway
MKLASFAVDGATSYGVVAGDHVIDIGRRLGDRFPTLLAVLAADAVSKIERVAEGQSPDHDLRTIRLLPPIPAPGKIICVGRNFRAHIAEANMKIPEYPNLFVRFEDTLVGHGGPLVRPRISTDFDYEGELAVIIGTPGRHIPESTAARHIAGYSCFNDATLRDYQFKHSLTAGKNFVSTAGFGPWLVTRSAIADHHKLMLSTRLNGIEVQRTRMDDFIFDIPTLISYVSTFTPLRPGDVIATGTPEGVGFARTPPLWLKPGDVIDVEISEIGLLRNTVIAEDEDSRLDQAIIE